MFLSTLTAVGMIRSERLGLDFAARFLSTFAHRQYRYDTVLWSATSLPLRIHECSLVSSLRFFNFRLSILCWSQVGEWMKSEYVCPNAPVYILSTVPTSKHPYRSVNILSGRPICCVYGIFCCSAGIRPTQVELISLWPGWSLLSINSFNLFIV